MFPFPSSSLLLSSLHLSLSLNHFNTLLFISHFLLTPFPIPCSAFAFLSPHLLSFFPPSHSHQYYTPLLPLLFPLSSSPSVLTPLPLISTLIWPSSPPSLGYSIYLSTTHLPPLSPFTPFSLASSAITSLPLSLPSSDLLTLLRLLSPRLYLTCFFLS